MELLHLYLHLQILEMGQFLEMHQPRRHLSEQSALICKV
jgi:hypothetical protein